MSDGGTTSILNVSLRALFEDGTLRNFRYHEAHGYAAASLLVLPRKSERHRWEGLPGDFAFLTLPFLREFLHLAYRGMHLFPQLKRSLSADSKALYLGRSAKKARGWLLQYLPPHSATSHHFHTAKTERFINLAGRCRVGLDGRETMLAGTDATATPGTPHYLRTGATPALNLLIISGPADPLSMDDHHYLPPPVFPQSA